MRAATTVLEHLQQENEILRQALLCIRDTVEDMPGGIDYDAREENLSPEDLIAHLGGLIYRRADEALSWKG